MPMPMEFDGHEYSPRKPIADNSPKATVREGYKELGGADKAAPVIGKGRSVSHAYQDPNSPVQLGWDGVLRLTRAGVQAFGLRLAKELNCDLVPRKPPIDTPPVEVIAGQINRVAGDIIDMVLQHRSSAALDNLPLLKRAEDLQHLLISLRVSVTEKIANGDR